MATSRVAAYYQAHFPAGECPARVETDQPLGSGGAGEVYHAFVDNAPGIGGPSRWAAKTYKREITARELAKLDFLIQNRIAVTLPNRIAQPKAILFTERDHHPAGYLMEILPHDQWRPLVDWYNTARYRQVTGRPDAEPDDSLLQRIAANLAQVVGDIHRAGHSAGDLSETNALANAGGAVALLDSDGWQINPPDGMPWNCAIARSEYTPPEVLTQLGKPCRNPDCDTGGPHQAQQGCIPRTPDHDNFILACLIFKLLMRGEEPFGQGSNARHLPPDRNRTEDHIKAGNFRYGSRHYECCGPRTDAARKRWENLPQNFREHLESALSPPHNTP